MSRISGPGHWMINCCCGSMLGNRHPTASKRQAALQRRLKSTASIGNQPHGGSRGGISLRSSRAVTFTALSGQTFSPWPRYTNVRCSFPSPLQVILPLSQPSWASAKCRGCRCSLTIHHHRHFRSIFAYTNYK